MKKNKLLSLINNINLLLMELFVSPAYYNIIFIFIFIGSVNGQKKFPFDKAENKGMSIMQIDLNDSLGLQTIVDIDSNLYLGHPTSFISNKDEITIIYLTGHALGNIRSVKSYDGGINWIENLDIPEEWNILPDTNIYTGYKVNSPFTQVPTAYKLNPNFGEERVFLYTGVFTPRAGEYFPARYASMDLAADCRTWSSLRPLVFGGKTISPNVLFADLIKLKDGKYLGTFHFDDRNEEMGNNGKIFTAVTENGYEFTEPKLAVEFSEAFLCEAGLIRSPDGSSIAMLMRENNRIFNSFISISHDEGITWSQPRQLPDALTGDRHQGVVLPDGRLFISFRDVGVESSTRGDWVGWIGKFDDLLAGSEGEYRIRFKDNLVGYDCGYPTIHLFENGDIFLATYGHWEENYPPYILAYRINIRTLDKLSEKSK
ncbi:sialidase family protein [Membranihabitans maritimus]|uniref:sialidase family protein n=1 Tax=Membranihabitans maritimus TaxID=2904244 RepID=UPI001F215180|nr:sialidase family protein [Membranihabitans maritimus]